MIDFWRVVPKKRRVRINTKKGVIFINPSEPKRILFRFGNLLIIGAFVYFVYLYYPLGAAVFTYATKDIKVLQIRKPEPKIETTIEKKAFRIEIPKILATAKIETNVSPFNKNEYLKVLENNVVAQAKNSALPGEGKGKTVYLFAHSTQQGLNMVRKNAVFYLLGQLKNDDLVYIYQNGKKYTYKVYQQKIINPSNIQYFSYSEKDNEVLILQTCWPIGTDWKRLLVFAKLVEG